MNVYITSAIVAAGTTMFSATGLALTIDLPPGTQVHQLDISTDEPVVINYAGNTFLSGQISTPESIFITGSGELSLNPDLQLSGVNGEGPDALIINGSQVSRVILATPFTSNSSRRFALDIRTGSGGRIEVAADVQLSQGGINLEAVNGRIIIGSSVNIVSEMGFNIVSDGTFFEMLSDSRIEAPNVNHNVFVLVSGGISIAGDIRTVSPIFLRTEGLVDVSGELFNNDQLGPLLLVQGQNVNLRSPVTASGLLNITADETINVFGAPLTSDTEINLTASTTNLFGGILDAPSVCIEGELNNFGATVSSACN